MKRLIDYFDRGVTCFPDNVCIRDGNNCQSYREVAAQTHAAGHDLLDSGFGKGHVMSIVSPNCSEVLVALLAAVRIGTVWCNLNSRNTVDSNLGLLKRNGCELLYFHSSMAEMAARALEEVPTMKRIVCLDRPHGGCDSLGGIIEQNLQKGPVPYVHIADTDTIMQIHTGGTTGEPQITEQSNRMLTTMMMAFATVLRYDGPPVNLAVAPLTHASGPIALAHMGLGGEIVIMAKADPESIMRAVGEHKVTTLFLPPTVTYMILAHPDVDKCDFRSLKYWVSTSAPIAPAKIAEVTRRFGPVIMNIYGQTESGFPVTCLSPGEVAEAVADESLSHRLDSCGRPTLYAQVAILDEEGNELAAGETGEIATRGANLVTGYLNNPEGTAKMRTADGWQRTGDVGHRDEEGYIYISDRKRDMIVSGGFNIYPIEIESALQDHAKVQDCAVIGVPDDKWGEAVKAVILLKPGCGATAEEIQDFCRERLGGMKTPKSVEFWDDLPRSPVGKVLKRDIREKFWRGRDRRIN